MYTQGHLNVAMFLALWMSARPESDGFVDPSKAIIHL